MMVFSSCGIDGKFGVRINLYFTIAEPRAGVSARSRGLSQSALQLFESDGRFASPEGGNAFQIVLAVFQILTDGLARVVALATPGLFRKRLELFFKFGFESNAEHSTLGIPRMTHSTSTRKTAELRSAGQPRAAVPTVIHVTTNFFRTAMFLLSSPGLSMGVSAMKAAWARRGSFSRRRNGSMPMVPLPICWWRSSFDPQAALASLQCQTRTFFRPTVSSRCASVSRNPSSDTMSY